MTITSRRRRTGSIRSGACRIRLLLLLGGVATISACSNSHTDADSASAMVSSLGAVPIPSATSAQAMPIATQNRPQLLAMGAPVRATLPGGVDAVVTALGPQEQTPYTGGATPPRSTVGIITVTMAVTHGDLAVRSSDFTSRDETGKLVVLAARGPAAVHLRAGQSAQIEVSGRFTSGSAQVTWRHAGHVVALWDFTVELD